MTVRLVVLGTETRHHHIWPEAPDLPDDIGKNFVAVPNAQCFGRAFRKAEIDCAREKLPAMIEPARGEKFLCADDTEALAQLGPDQVLPAVAARDGKIGGVIKRTIRPKRDEIRVLIVRMRGHVEHAAKHVQFLERELNFRGIHRLRKHPRRRIGRAQNNCTHEKKSSCSPNKPRDARNHRRSNGIPASAPPLCGRRKQRRLFIDILLRLQPINQRFDAIFLLIRNGGRLRFLRVFRCSGKIAGR